MSSDSTRNTPHTIRLSPDDSAKLKQLADETGIPPSVLGASVLTLFIAHASRAGAFPTLALMQKILREDFTLNYPTREGIQGLHTGAAHETLEGGS